MQIKVNGEVRQLAAEISISRLLEELKLDSKFLAVERNRELVPRGQHATCLLQEADEIEIVTLVGGG